MSSHDTAKKFFHSSGAATFSQFWRSGVTLIVYLLLRRFLPREDWGLFEWVLAVFLILGAVRDAGLLYHIIRIKPRPYGNLLVVELGWGTVLFLGTVAGAPLLALLLKQPHPETLDVIRAMSLFLFFEGLAIVPKTFFDAELRVGRTVLPEIVRNLIFATLSLSMALTGFGVWSLVVAQIACTIYYAAHLWVRARGQIPWNWQRGETAALVLRSLPLATIWFLAVFVMYVDPIILGLRFSDAVIGEYTFAYKLAFLVPLVVVPAITRTLYPALVAFKDEPRKLMEAYRLGTLFVLGLMAPAAGFLFANPEIPQIISSEYVIADSLLVLLCFAPLVDPFSRLGGEVLKTFHKDRLWILSVALTLASFIGFGMLFTSRFGPVGMAWANFLQIGMLPMAWGIYRLAPGPFRRLLRDLLLLYAIPVIPFLALKLVLPDQVWIRMGLSIIASLAVVGVYYRLFGRSFIEFFRAGATSPTERSPGP